MGNRLILAVATDVYNHISEIPENAHEFVRKAIHGGYKADGDNKNTGHFRVKGQSGFQRVSLNHNSMQELIFAHDNQAEVIEFQTERLHQETRDEAIFRIIKSYLNSKGYSVRKKAPKKEK